MGLCLIKLTFILSFVTIVLLFGFGIEPILFIRHLSSNVRIEEASPRVFHFVKIFLFMKFRSTYYVYLQNGLEFLTKI